MMALGIDIGGSGIKAALADTRRGRLPTPRRRVATPQPATPRAVARAVARMIQRFAWKGPVGCALPAVVKDGRVRTAANISRGWLGVDARALLGEATGRAPTVINDADAAGWAEMTFGAGRGSLVIMVTLGTGIGTALFMDGRLVPNTELGHLELRGRDAEKWAASSVREKGALGWRKWSRRVDAYLHLLQRYFWPDLVIVGGGVSTKWRKFLPRLTLPTPVVPAQPRNDAGMIGAALACGHERRRARRKRASAQAGRELRLRRSASRTPTGTRRSAARAG
jgi:polyphosphate glucokinase